MDDKAEMGSRKRVTLALFPSVFLLCPLFFFLFFLGGVSHLALVFFFFPFLGILQEGGVVDFGRIHIPHYLPFFGISSSGRSFFLF